MHEGGGSVWEIYNDSTGYVRRSENPGKSSVELTDMIPVGVGLHMLYADDIVSCGTRSEVVENKLEEWRRAMEDRGLKIYRKKTIYLRFNVDGNLDVNSDINIQGVNLERVSTFKYLGSTLTENGDLHAEMTHRIQSGWTNWKRISGFCATEE